MRKHSFAVRIAVAFSILFLLCVQLSCDSATDSSNTAPKVSTNDPSNDSENAARRLPTPIILKSKIENVRIVDGNKVLADVTMDPNEQLVFYWLEVKGGLGLFAQGTHQFVFEYSADGKFSATLGPDNMLGPSPFHLDSGTGGQVKPAEFKMRESVEVSEREYGGTHPFTTTLYTFGDVEAEDGEKQAVGIRINPEPDWRRNERKRDE